MAARVSNLLDPTRIVLQLQSTKRTPAIHEVILAARWALYGETTRFGSEKGSRAYLVADESGQLSIENSQMLLRAHLQRQIALLLKAGKTVVLVAQVPEMGFDAQRCVLMRKAYGQSADACAIDRARVVARQAFVTGLLADASEAGNVRVVDPKIVLCDAISCPALLNGQPAYRDDNHLTSFVARILVQRFWGSTGDR